MLLSKTELQKHLQHLFAFNSDHPSILHPPHLLLPHTCGLSGLTPNLYHRDAALTPLTVVVPQLHGREGGHGCPHGSSQVLTAHMEQKNLQHHPGRLCV